MTSTRKERAPQGVASVECLARAAAARQLVAVRVGRLADSRELVEVPRLKFCNVISREALSEDDAGLTVAVIELHGVHCSAGPGIGSPSVLR